ncbi:unnamed protein product [Prorocentrum cordatum]|uniref:Uncharacterized protein n=1 Tax=Prorocentrum cordatum TaxID=2364126 RepID=A0ABN9UBS6_9DINO|nr:unnamed protein product [Polarella glacialis]
MGGAMCCAAAAGEPIPEPSRWRDATPVCAEETEPMMYPCGYADIDVDCGRGGNPGAHGRQLWCVALVLLPLAGRDVSHDRVAAVFSGRGLVSLSGARAQDDRAALAAYFPNRHVRRRRARRIGRQVAGCLGTKRGGGCSRPGATD